MNSVELMRGIKKGARVRAIKGGYGKKAGRVATGTVREDSYGMLNYIIVDWDDGSCDRGYYHTFNSLEYEK